MEGETIVTEPETVPEQPAEQPPPAEAPDMLAVRTYYAGLQTAYAQRISEIEAFLGFLEGSEALGTRLARIEAFLGIKT